jgi:hypothetical protein
MANRLIPAPLGNCDARREFVKPSESALRVGKLRRTGRRNSGQGMKGTVSEVEDEPVPLAAGSTRGPDSLAPDAARPFPIERRPPGT